MMDKVVIKTKLTNKGIHLGNILCKLCAKSEGSVTHLYFDFKITKVV